MRSLRMEGEKEEREMNTLNEEEEVVVGRRGYRYWKQADELDSVSLSLSLTKNQTQMKSKIKSHTNKSAALTNNNSPIKQKQNKIPPKLPPPWHD